MGQRSQIYVRFNNEFGEKKLVARHFSWNYGERMISRARWTIEWLKEYISYDGRWLEKNGETKAYFDDYCYLERLVKIIETNFDIHDVADTSDIVKELKEDFAEELSFEDVSFIEYVFVNYHNNDGKLFIDIADNGTIKYAFADKHANTENIMDGNEYMKWQKCSEFWKREPSEYFTAEDIKTCEENIAAIEEMATLMTKEELEDFINYDYK